MRFYSFFAVLILWIVGGFQSAYSQTPSEPVFNSLAELAAPFQIVDSGDTFDLSLRGQIGKLKYTSESDGVERSIFYYFPNSLVDQDLSQDSVGSFFFLHGGGSTTTEDYGASYQAVRRTKNFIHYAETRKVILIVPSTSVGWNAHTSYFLRNFIRFCQSKLALDSDRRVLGGQSMGGLGITREYPWMTDLFTGFLALGSGTPPNMINENAMMPYFNGTPYIHFIGDNDTEFPIFMERMIAFEKALKELERSKGKSTRFSLLFRSGGHDFTQDIDAVEAHLDTLFSYKQNRYPKFFQTRFDIARYPDRSTPTLKNPKIQAVVDEGFWIRVRDFHDTPEDLHPYLLLEVSVVDQLIRLTSKVNTLKPSEIEMRLNEQIVDLSQAVVIELDGKVVYRGVLPRSRIVAIKAD